MPPVWIPYCGSAPLPAEWLGRWNLDPWLVAALGLALGIGMLSVQGRGRLYLAAGFALMAVMFISPFCALSSALFSVRTAHHVLLVAAVAPLLAWSLPRSAAIGPLAVTAFVHAAVFWLWHAPGLYGWALSNDGAYWLMQLSLLGSAVGFWQALRRATAPSAVAALLGVMVAMGLLAALITFAPSALYAPHLVTTWAWGLDPLQDQQLAGLIMWAPAALVYLGGALAILGLHISERPSGAGVRTA